MRWLRLYLALFSIAALGPLLATVAINSVGFLVYRQTPGTDLLNDRLAKLERVSQINLVLLGDSSLGNAVNEHLLSALSGQRAVNLALSGNYGYAGSLAMLERLLERHRPSTVVLFHTLDAFGRKTKSSDFGYFHASNNRLRAFLADGDVRFAVWDSLASATTAAKWVEAWWQGANAKVDPAIDYVPQNRSIRDRFTGRQLDRVIDERLHLAGVNPANTKYLDRIAALCRAHKMRCLYAHGPMADEVVGRASGFLARINPLIERQGLELLPSTPLPLPYQDIGDSEDHVAFAAKDRFTARFAGLLLDRLDARQVEEKHNLQRRLPHAADQTGGNAARQPPLTSM